MATSNPATVTARAATFRLVGMVMTPVFRGRTLQEITYPAMMLPQASRLIGLITSGLFSLIGASGRKRGDPIATKYTKRKLYTAVKEVATSVRVRAQAFR